MGVVGKIGIHLKDVAVVALQRPFETGNIRCAQTQLSSPFNHVEVWKFLLQPFDDGCCAVGRIVLDDEDVKVLLQREDTTDDVLDVFLLVIGRYDD